MGSRVLLLAIFHRRKTNWKQRFIAPTTDVVYRHHKEHISIRASLKNVGRCRRNGRNGAGGAYRGEGD